MELERGFLIAGEGIDGTGKSTQCGMLADHLESAGIDVVRLREPTSGPWGQKIRKILTEGREGVSKEEELEYFINDRKEDVALNIQPALDKKQVVVLDRYYYSTAAYQGALGFDPEKILESNEAFAPRPDLMLLFHLPPEESLKRIETGRDGFSSFEKKEYLAQVQNIFETFEGQHIRRISAQGSIGEIHDRVLSHVRPLLGLKEIS